MSGVPVYGLGGVWPRLGRDVYIAPTAAVIGDVTLGDGVSVWFGAVIRGDEGPIRIGASSNIQDGTIIHSNPGGPEMLVGERVTVGHGVRLHGCLIESDVLIGIGAIVLDGAVVESGAIVAAGALVPPGRRVGAGELWAGVPAVRRRPVSEAERRLLAEAPAIYSADSRRYREGCAERRVGAPAA